MDEQRPFLKRAIGRMRESFERIINQDVSLQVSYNKKVNDEEETKGWLWRLHKFCKWIGTPIPLFSMLLMIAVLGFLAIGTQALILEVGAYLFSQLVNFAFKAIFKRERPPTSIFWSPIPPDKYSFPSGHAAGTMSIAVGLSAVIPGAWVVLFPWSFMMGLSRFFGHYHYPSDVIVGFLVGLFSGYVSVVFLIPRMIG